MWQIYYLQKFPWRWHVESRKNLKTIIAKCLKMRRCPQYYAVTQIRFKDHFISYLPAVRLVPLKKPPFSWLCQLSRKLLVVRVAPLRNAAAHWAALLSHSLRKYPPNSRVLFESISSFTKAVAARVATATASSSLLTPSCSHPEAVSSASSCAATRSLTSFSWKVNADNAAIITLHFLYL